MSRHLYRMLMLGAVYAAMTAGAGAQTTHIDHDHAEVDGGSHIVCGSIVFNDGKEREALARTKENNPELYQRLVERAKYDNRPRVLDGEIIQGFIVRNRVTGQYDEIEATLKYEGADVRIWVDNADTGRVTAKTINQLARGLDSNSLNTPGKPRDRQKSIIRNVTDVYGQPPSRFAQEGKTDFLLTDIKDGFGGSAFVAGFFSPWDQTTNPGSNKMNLLYIDSKEGLGTGVNEVLSTLAHEFQHLVHYNTNNESQTLWNEGCSEVASILAGYQSRGIPQFLANTNVALFSWNHDDGNKVLADYQRALAVVYYMYEQHGEEFLAELARTKSESMDRVADALTALGRGADWKTLYSNFTVANYLRTFMQPYGYRNPLSTSIAKASESFTNTDFPTSGSAAVQQYASAYLSYTRPGGMKITFDAGQPFRVHAILYKGTSVPVEIRTLEDGVQYSIGENTSYDKVVFAITNLAFNAQTIDWSIEKFTSSVEDQTSGANALEVSTVTPNPASGPATIDFTTAVAGPVTLQVYDLRGAVVRTLVDGDRYEAGAHQYSFTTDGLPSGYYVVRLTQGDRSASRVLAVTK